MDKPTCSIGGCDDPVHGRGWCTYHHLNWLRWSDPLATGHIRRRRWTDAEDDTIRSRYGTTAAGQIAEQIRRTENAVWLRAKSLGLEKRPEVTPWTAGELGELQRCYATELPAELAARLGRTSSSVYQQARALGLLSHKTLIGQSAVADYFTAIDTAEKAYILGLLAADGNVYEGRVNFGLWAQDGHLVEWVRDRLFPDAVVHTARRDGFRSFLMTCHPMAADLARWGVVPCKSRILGWPRSLPAAMLRPFLLGYFDGDGCAYVIRKGGRLYPGWNVASGSHEFLVRMKEHVRENTGVTLQKIQRRKGSELHQVSTTGRNAWIVNRWLHQDGLGLMRKQYAAHVIQRYEEEPS